MFLCIFAIKHIAYFPYLRGTRFKLLLDMLKYWQNTGFYFLDWTKSSSTVTICIAEPPEQLSDLNVLFLE